MDALHHRRAVTQHHHPVRQADGLGDIVGHQQRRLALLPYDAVDIRRYGQPCLIVQRRKGLSQQQYLRLGRQRPDQGAPLAHPAGELGGPLLSEVRQPVALQQLPDMGLPLRRILTPYRQAQRHVAPDAAPLEQLVPLGHEAHLPGGPAHRLPIQLRLKVVPVLPTPTAGWIFRSRRDPRCCKIPPPAHRRRHPAAPLPPRPGTGTRRRRAGSVSSYPSSLAIGHCARIGECLSALILCPRCGAGHRKSTALPVGFPAAMACQLGSI